MNKHLIRLSAMLVLAGACAPSRGQASRTFNVQGRLTAPNGVPKSDGVYSVAFTIYDGATAVWAETQAALTVTKGLFAASLGSIVPLPAGLNLGNKPYTLGLKVGADPEMTPRLPVSAAPYALALPYLRTEATAGDPNVVGGRAENNIIPGKMGATVSGGGATGLPNSVTDDYGTVSGGRGNSASFHAAVGGGVGNVAGNSYTAVPGGSNNHADGAWAAVGGGDTNAAGGADATIGGGLGNSATASFATIGGGGRTIPADNTTGNRVTDDYGTVAGGGNNQAGKNPTDAFPGPYATVGGGIGNTANGQSAVICGGEGNVAQGFWSTIGGGYHNTTLYSTSMILGGAFCTTGGYYSLAAGETAEAMHDGAFVWADASVLHFPSTQPNEFSVRARGGVRFVTQVDPSSGDPTAWLTLAPGGDNGAGRFLDTSTKGYLSTGGQWTSFSDRNAKRDFTPVNPRSILERVATMPVSEWSYKAESPSVRHIGPMAQDFAAAFRVGQDDLHIGSVDEGGVALAAIKGLYEMVKQKDARITALEKRLAALERSRK